MAINMKKYTKPHFAVTAIFLMAACLLFTGCAPARQLWENITNGENAEPYISPEGRLYNETVDKFFAALDAGDREAIRKLFSPKVQKEAVDLDAQINLLLETYPGPTDACGRDGRSVYGEYGTHYGSRTSLARSTFPVLSKGKYYWCSFELMYENDNDKEQLGITQIIFFSADYYCAVRYDEAGEGFWDTPGLSVYTDYPLDCEVRAINGYPYKYTSSAPLEEAQVKRFMQTSPGYSDFTGQFGEPNAVNVYYYYELPAENGEPRYLQLGVEEAKDSIFHISVVDDFGWLYNLWDAKDEYPEE